MPPSSHSLKKITLAVTTLTAFLIPFLGSSTNIALPRIGQELGIDTIVLSWIATSYILAAAVFLLPLGKLSDTVGRKKIFLMGLFIFAAASLFCAISFDAISLIAFRVIQGFGGSMLFATSMAIVISAFPPEERGRVLGLNVAAVYLGLSVGPFIGGFFTEHLGWRSLFYLNLLLSTVALIMSRRHLEDDPLPAAKQAFDWTGTFIYCVSLILLMYGAAHLTETNGKISAVTGIAGLLAFFWLEHKVANPLLELALFRSNPVFVYSNIAALINYMATFALSFILSLYLQYIRALSPQEAGLVMMAQPIVQAVFSPMAGRLSDRIEPRLVASSGMVMTIIGLLGFVFLNETTSLAWIIINLMFFGLGFALFSSPNTNAVMSAVDKRLYGIASATVGTMRLIGQTFSMAVAMFVISIYMGHARPLPENYPVFMNALQTLFVVFVVICLLGLLASLVRGNVRNSDTQAKVIKNLN